MSANVIIVGAGIVGVSAAYHLMTLGEKRVAVIDRQCLSAGATGRSGALVRSNYDNPCDARLALISLEMFRSWRDRIGGDCGFDAVGLLEFMREESAASFADLIARQRNWGVDIRLIDHVEVAAIAPRVRIENPSVAVAYEATAGCCDANLANRSLYNAARAGGVEFLFDEPVVALCVSSGRVTGVKTANRTIASDAVVVAAGAWANQLLWPLKMDFGLVTRLSQVAVFRPPELEYGEKFPTIIDHIQEAWFRPMPHGGVLVGAERGGRAGIDPNQIPDTISDRLVDAYQGILAYRFSVSPFAALRGSWAGSYMMSPDHRPVVGQHPRIANLFLACGDSGTSFKIAPAIGLGIAELIVHGRPGAVDLSSLTPERFAKEWFAGHSGEHRPSH